MDHINIAIDGPAGAGKSTVAKGVANKLQIIYLDTGAMYRAMALKLLRSGQSSPFDEKNIQHIVNKTDVCVANRNRKQHIYLDDEDVTDLIRSPEVTVAASDVAKFACVRDKLVQLQQGIARTNDVVMDGRDIGTVVLPDAPYKFFITATLEERAKRRFLEMQQTNRDITYEQVYQDIKARDINDSTREISPLRPAEDALLIDTTDLQIEQVIEMILQRVTKA